MMYDEGYRIREDVGTTCEPPRKTLATLAGDTTNALKEANMALDAIFNNLFGPRIEKEKDVPNPPVSCLNEVLGLNAEQSRVLANRIAELNARMFGKI